MQPNGSIPYLFKGVYGSVGTGLEGSGRWQHSGVPSRRRKPAPCAAEEARLEERAAEIVQVHTAVIGAFWEAAIGDIDHM